MERTLPGAGFEFARMELCYLHVSPASRIASCLELAKQQYRRTDIMNQPARTAYP
jgi:hypothetical protein